MYRVSNGTFLSKKRQVCVLLSYLYIYIYLYIPVTMKSSSRFGYTECESNPWGTHRQWMKMVFTPGRKLASVFFWCYSVCEMENWSVNCILKKRRENERKKKTHKAQRQTIWGISTWCFWLLQSEHKTLNWQQCVNQIPTTWAWRVFLNHFHQVLWHLRSW